MGKVFPNWRKRHIGTDFIAVEEFQRVVTVLNARPESRRIIDRMDRRFAALPGFDQLRIYRQAATPVAA